MTRHCNITRRKIISNNKGCLRPVLNLLLGQIWPPSLEFGLEALVFPMYFIFHIINISVFAGEREPGTNCQDRLSAGRGTSLSKYSRVMHVCLLSNMSDFYFSHKYLSQF